MKDKIYALAVTAFILATICRAASEQAAALSVSDLIGTWELISVRYGEEKEFSDAPKDEIARRFITPSHFIWARYDPETKVIHNSMGGTYTIKGDAYIEIPEFAVAGMGRFVGKEQKFTLKIEGDKWIQAGVLSNGNKIEEIWRRVK